MTAAEWGSLIPAIVGCLGALGAYPHSAATRAQLNRHVASEKQQKQQQAIPPTGTAHTAMTNAPKP